MQEFRKKIVPFDTTGTNRHTHMSGNKHYAKNRYGVSTEYTIERRRADSLLDALILTHSSPRKIHNIRLQYPINRQYYYDIDGPIQHRTKSKKIEHRIDRNVVSYLYYRNGTVTVTIACSKNPFIIDTAEDEYTIHYYLGQVRAKSLDHLSDSRGLIVPPLEEWLLVECDVNIDIEVTDAMQLSFPTIQIYPSMHSMQVQTKLACKLFFDVLRIYIKAIEDKAFLRFEGLMTPFAPVFDVLQDLRYPRHCFSNLKS